MVLQAHLYLLFVVTVVQGFPFFSIWRRQDVDQPTLPTAVENTRIAALASITTSAETAPSLQAAVVSQNVTAKVGDGQAQVSSAIPSFYDNLVNFTVTIPGSVTPLGVTTSATFFANDVAADPSPILILSPAHLLPGADGPANKQLGSGSEQVQIIAVTINVDKTILFHLQLSNGTVARLISDGFVQDIYDMDFTKPPELVITTTHSVAPVKRDLKDLHERAAATKRSIAALAGNQVDKRGMPQSNPYTTIASEKACAAMLCIGSILLQPAFYDPNQSSCYCQDGASRISQPHPGTRLVSGLSSDLRL